jgi:hypothetical protein
MPKTTLTVTVAVARAEIARRSHPKGSPERMAIPAFGTAAHVAFGMSGPELAAIAGKPARTPKPAPAPAPVPAPATPKAEPKAPAFDKSDSEIRKAIFAHVDAQDIPKADKSVLYRKLLAQAGLEAKRALRTPANA